MKTRPSKLLGMLALVAAIGSALATPCRASSTSEQQQLTAADAKKVHDSLQKMNAALAASLAKKPQRPRGALSGLVADGFLEAFPSVPEGIGDGSGYFGKGDYGSWSDRNARIGGCGPKSVGEKQTFNIVLRNVSDEFCKEYNKAQGLPAAVLGNCEQNPDDACKASGSADGDAPVDAGTTSFCFKTADQINIVFFNTGLDARVSCSP